MRVAFDTNVLVRILVGDDPIQTKKAEKAFVHYSNAEGVFVSLVVLAEISWVLRAAYRWERSAIVQSLSRLIRTQGVVVEELEIVQRALNLYVVGKAEFSDYLIIERSRASDAGAQLLTFDRNLARTPGVTLL